MDRRLRGRFLAGVAVAVLVVVAVLSSPDAALRHLDWLAAHPVRFGLALVGVAAVRPLLGWPTTLLAVAAGYAYGLVGAPFALLLVVLTSVPTYLLGGRLAGTGRAAVAAREFRAETGDVRAVTASRLFPAPSDVVSGAAGLAGVPLVPFLVGTAVGEIPWVVAGTLVGASLDTLSAGSLSAVADPRLVAAAALVAVLSFARPAYRYTVAGDE